MFRILFVLLSALAPMLAHAVTCDAGYYLDENSECAECNTPKHKNHPYYCPGDDLRHDCPANTTDYATITGAEFLYTSGHSLWAYTNSDAITDCAATATVHTTRGSFLAEQAWTGTNYWNGVQKLWFAANNGYYLSSPWFTTYLTWYHDIKQCTNAPENTTYTGPGTPDNADNVIVDANDCPWRCSDGFGRTASNTCATLCKAGVTKLNTSTGIVVPLFATANTVPAIHIKKCKRHVSCRPDTGRGRKCDTRPI